MRRISTVLALVIASITGIVVSVSPALAAPHEVFLHAPGDSSALVGGCSGKPESGGRSGIACTQGTWARYTITVTAQSGKTAKRLALGPALNTEYMGPGCSYFGTDDPAVLVTFRVMDGDGTNGRVDGRASYKC
jgi:hypothetical protein